MFGFAGKRRTPANFFYVNGQRLGMRFTTELSSTSNTFSPLARASAATMQWFNVSMQKMQVPYVPQRAATAVEPKVSVPSAQCRSLDDIIAHLKAQAIPYVREAQWQSLPASTLPDEFNVGTNILPYTCKWILWTVA